jgi:hypothetical protein
MDGRAGRHPQILARRLWWAYARLNWRLLLRVLGMLAMVTVVGSVPALLSYGPFGRGFVVGSLTTLCLGFVVWAVAHESGALRAWDGAIGEQNTARVLRRLERRGWQIRNDVLFDGFNVDHVALGPGGVYAIETKSTAGRWDFNAAVVDPLAESALRQARLAARKIRLLLSAVGDIDVTPVLVCWGPNVEEVPGGSVVHDGVVVIVGRDGEEAVRNRFQASEVLDPFAVDCAVHHIDAFVAGRDRHERLRRETVERSASDRS